MTGNKNINFIIIGSWILIYLFLWFNHESVTVHNGLGWDGVRYGRMAQHFTTLFHERSFNSYYFQRTFLPGTACLIVYVWNMIRDFFNIGTPVELTDSVVIQVFALVNYFLLMVSGFIFIKISDLFNFKASTKILGFSLLFFSYAILKHNFYYPVLTDTLAFSLGILLLYFCLANKYKALLVTSLVGYFSFPTIFYTGLILFLFEKKTIARKATVNNLLALKDKFILVSLFFLVLTYITLIYLNLHTSFAGKTRTGNNFSCVSILVAVYYVYIGGKYLVTNDLADGLINSIDGKKVIISVTLFLVLKFINFYYSYYSDHSWIPMSLPKYFFLILSESIANPGTFLVSHFFYFGPFIALLFFFWNDFLIELKAQSYGYQLIVAMFFLLALGSESRQLINMVPFFVFPLIKVLDRCNFKKYFYGIMVILSLIVSRFWFDFNITQNDVDRPLDFPAQYYFMNYGYWLSDSVYIVALVLMMLFFLLIWAIINISSGSKTEFTR